MSSPLLIGCDLTTIPESTLQILKNQELIALNQDPACLQAYVVKEVGDVEIWVKDLGETNSREKAVVLLNRGETTAEISLNWKDAGLDGEIQKVRDLWEHRDLEPSSSIRILVEPHEAKAYRVTAEKSCEVSNLYAEEEWATQQQEQVVSPEEALQMEGILIDVRTEEEYAAEHPEGAINIPYTMIHSQAKKQIPDKKAKILLYCSTGKRSSNAAKSLIYLGYRNVYRIQK